MAVCEPKVASNTDKKKMNKSRLLYFKFDSKNKVMPNQVTNTNGFKY